MPYSFYFFSLFLSIAFFSSILASLACFHFFSLLFCFSLKCEKFCSVCYFSVLNRNTLIILMVKFWDNGWEDVCKVCCVAVLLVSVPMNISFHGYFSFFASSSFGFLSALNWKESRFEGKFLSTILIIFERMQFTLLANDRKDALWWFFSWPAHLIHIRVLQWTDRRYKRALNYV